jgi:energy-coupling factor transport system ATP-binding protein
MRYTVVEDIAFVLENDCMAQEEMFRKVDGVAYAGFQL